MSEVPAFQALPSASERGDNETLREVDLPPADQALREDVKRLGGLVGEVIADQEGESFFDQVERIRRTAIQVREGQATLDTLMSALEQQPLDRAEALVRAFATWFGAVNLAERVHRIRRRRDYQRDAADTPQPGGLLAVIKELAADGLSFEQLLALLRRMHIEPVFTAHPTEAVRRALLEKEAEIVRCLIDDIDRTRTPQEQRVDQARMRMALTAGWQTAENVTEKPTVADELEHVSYYFGLLYRVIPVFHELLADAVRDVYGKSLPSLPDLLRFGTWVGGDMDGNPNVGADTLRATLFAQHTQVLAAYRADLAHLQSLLSQSSGRIGVDPRVLMRIDDYRGRLGEEATGIVKSRHADMPYRVLIGLMHLRLEATVQQAPNAYRDAHELLDDLQLIAHSLQTQRGEHAGLFALRRVMRRVETFGFHLATLDQRQDSRVHEAALAVLLQTPDWALRTAESRAMTLAECLRELPALPARETFDETTRQCLQTFEALAALSKQFSPAALGPYIVSMSRSAADALAVLVLARFAGHVDRTGDVPIDVVPLFETVNDLDAATQVVTALLDDPAYRSHLQRRGNRQMVMLGYSDSAKDAGLAASRWAIQRAQIALTALASEHGIRIVFFHGRGGSASRGGSKTERAIIAAPRGSVDGYLRLTEQGEVIHRRYGIRALALRNLEQATSAVLRATARPRPPEPREGAWRQIMGQIAEDSRRTYRELVHEDKGFAGYFRAATPIDVIERLKLGSRPAKRAAGGQLGVESLRAIPWVFAWSQNRCGMTAWYGIGSALQAAIETHGLEALTEMARDWPFFATFIDDVEMVLAKTEMAIFTRYSVLAGDAHADFYPRIKAEFLQTQDAVLAIKGSPELLASDRRLRISIRLRNPYVDPISLLQVDLLRRWRAAGRPDDGLFHALATTVNGIAAGMQNTG
ncbi:MAG: Phosphoenolpyruvate carboxylase [Alphaproteobacteria bacterium ADurb.BinA280]|nr:MAG: Phosphoenolpyruvate carboxylase [Alphaproteobacteria bacterium ADurb.BinA280]